MTAPEPQTDEASDDVQVARWLNFQTAGYSSATTPSCGDRGPSHVRDLLLFRQASWKCSAA